MNHLMRLYVGKLVKLWVQPAYPSTVDIRVCLIPETFSYVQITSPHSLCQAYNFEHFFPFLGFFCTFLFYLSMCIIWHLTNHTAVYNPSEEGNGSFIFSTKWLSLDYLPAWARYRLRPAGCREPMLTTEADLSLCLF